MALIQTLVVNLRANTSKFTRGMRRASGTLRRFTAADNTQTGARLVHVIHTRRSQEIGI